MPIKKVISRVGSRPKTGKPAGKAYNPLRPNAKSGGKPTVRGRVKRVR